MPITPPVAHGNIDSAAWGIPLTNEVNRLTALTAPGAWTAATLTGGWVNFGGTEQNAQYRKLGDLVQLRGAIKSGTVGTAAFNLPAGFRPPANVAFAVSSAGAFGNLAVGANGDVTPANGSTGSFNLSVAFSITA
jgi:hypothetical protein